MTRISLKLLIMVSIAMIFSGIAHAQQAEAPAYKDGEWWRIKVEFTYERGVSRSGACTDMYPVYLVRIVEGKPRVFGVKGGNPEATRCGVIVRQLLFWKEAEDEAASRGGEELYLKFPISVGSTWSSRIRLGEGGGPRSQVATVNVEHKALALEKVSTPKGELEAFKIQASAVLVSGMRSGPPEERTETYYYSPKAKAIIRYEFKSPLGTRTVTLTDFNVTP